MDKLVGFVLSVSRVTLSLEPFLVLGILAILFRHFLIFRRQCPSCKLDRNLDDYYQISYATDVSIPVNLNPFINDNMFPASATRIEIEKSLKRLETNAACFEKILKHQQNAISQVALILKRYEEAYAKTRSEQHHMEKILDRHRSALSSPIRSLPDDLLVVIFQFTSPNAAYNDQFPWIATGVCRQWRAVAHSSRILWSQFSIDPFVEDPPHRLPQTSIFAYYGNAWGSSHVASEVETKSKGAVGRTITKSIINKALEYSRGSPLTLSFNSLKAKGDMSKVAAEWFDIFINLAPRWKHITLAIESPFIEKLFLIMGHLSMLESLDVLLRDNVDLPPFASEIFRLAPRLRKVVCRSSFTEFIFPWKQLQEFSVNAFPLSWDYYHQILCSGSNLEILDLQACWGNFDTQGKRPGDNTDPAITLPYLRVLKICSGLNTLLDFVVIPKLTAVTIRGAGGDNVTPRLSSLIERSACALRSLSFDYVDYNADFTQLLRTCSSLTSLSIDSYDGQALFDVMARSSSILPSLESFIIGGASNNNTNTITYDYVISIIEMLEARRSCLKEFSIRIYFGASRSEEIQENSTTPSTESGVAAWLSPSDRLRLETMAGAGMKIHIDSYYLSRDRWSGTVIPCVSLGAGSELISSSVF